MDAGVLGFNTFKMYLCTGERSWTSRIKDPDLKWFLRLLLNFCDWGKELHFEEFLDNMSKIAADGKEMSKEFKDSFWSGAVTTLRIAICQEDGDTALKALTGFLTLSWCERPGYGTNWISKLLCIAGKFVVENPAFIKGAIKPMTDCSSDTEP